MVKILSWITTFSIFILIAIAFLHPTSELSLDLGEHIRFGELIVKNHVLPTTNLFSYTYPNAPFIHHEFVPDVIFYLLYQSFGISSLILFTSGVVLVSFGLLFFYLYKRVSPVVLFISSLVYIRMLFERTYVRPEIFSYLFISIFVLILMVYRKRFTKWVYALIPLQFLWVNSHIYFIIGLLLIGLVFIEMALTKRKALETKILGVVLLLCCLVCLINPNGIAGAMYPFTVFHNYGFSVQENNSIFAIEQLNPNHIIYSILFFKIAAVSLFLLLCFFARTTGLMFWAVSLVGIVLAATSIRNFPIFIFATFVPFVLLLQHFAKWSYNKVKGRIIDGKPGLAVGSLVVLLGVFLWHIQLVAGVQGIGLGAADAAKPAVDFYVSHHMSGPTFNNYGIGSYLVFRLYPKEKVFVDGRPEAYPTSFFQSVYTPMQTDPSIFEQVSHKYKFNTIIFDYPAEQTSASRIFLKSLVSNPAWQMVYVDDTVAVFVRDNGQNKGLIKKYGITEQSFNLTLFEKNPSSLENLAYFLGSVGWEEKREEVYQLLLSKDPTNCEALAYLVTILASQNDPGTQVLQYRYQTACSR